MKVDPSTISAGEAYGWQAATILPRPIAWVATLNEDGSANLAPFSFFTGVSSDPPTVLICVARKRKEPDGTRQRKDTWRNIERTGEFVVHVVNAALGEPMNATARDLPYGVDEIAQVGLTKLACDKVAAPRIAEAPVAMECKLERIVEVGRTGTAVIIGEILLWHISDDILVEGRIDPHRIDAIGRMGGAGYVRTRDIFEMSRPK
jgi:flavin reductase (DIM6/NTAB) family NADH-FMN oxidoreductase RutF